MISGASSKQIAQTCLLSAPNPPTDQSAFLPGLFKNTPVPTPTHHTHRSTIDTNPLRLAFFATPLWAHTLLLEHGASASHEER